MCFWGGGSEDERCVSYLNKKIEGNGRVDWARCVFMCVCLSFLYTLCLSLSKSVCFRVTGSLMPPTGDGISKYVSYVSSALMGRSIFVLSLLVLPHLESYVMREILVPMLSTKLLRMVVVLVSIQCTCCVHCCVFEMRSIRDSREQFTQRDLNTHIHTPHTCVYFSRPRDVMGGGGGESGRFLKTLGSAAKVLAHFAVCRMVWWYCTVACGNIEM